MKPEDTAEPKKLAAPCADKSQKPKKGMNNSYQKLNRHQNQHAEPFAFVGDWRPSGSQQTHLQMN
jgi:hypothetical protein